MGAQPLCSPFFMFLPDGCGCRGTCLFLSLKFSTFVPNNQEENIMQLPAAFVDYTRALLGEKEYARLSAALLEAEQPVSIRLNPWKRTGNSSFSILHSSLKEVPWATEAYYLDRRLTFTFDPLFHAGCYYVQEASSMFLEQAVRQYVPDRPLAALDLCAAPGGKSTHLRSLLPAGSLLVANEVMRGRAPILAENLTKWGHPDVVVTNSDPAEFTPLEALFDFILTDVPCSGEGMFRKDETAIGEWSPENVEICRQRQRRILTDIWPCLKPGGLLVYSTCTYNTKENEENVRWICDELGAEALPLDVPDGWGVTGNLLAGEDFPVYRFLPHKTQGEGFFLAVLRKAGEAETEDGDGMPMMQTCRVNADKQKGKKGNGGKASFPSAFGKEQLAVVQGWLRGAEGYTLMPEGQALTAFPTAWLPLLSALKRRVRILQAGTEVAGVKGRDCIPTHALAMSCLLEAEAFAREEVDYPTAIAYLRKEAVTLSGAASRGFVLLTYRGFPLGFVKNIGNRANNLYPQEWRIRSGYLPEEIRTL